MRIEARAMRPQTQWNDRHFETLMQRALTRTSSQARRDLKATTRTWTKQPRFYVKRIRRRGEVGFFAGTDNVIYKYVDEGTEPHPIRPKNAKMLRFQSGYTAKTKPGILRAGAGGAFGNTVWAKEVMHPGTEARGFTKLVAERMQTKLQKEINLALAEWIRDSIPEPARRRARRR